MASNRNNGRRQNRQTSFDEQMRQVMADMQTAAQLLRQSGQDLSAAADNMNSGRQSNQRNDPYGTGSPRSKGDQTGRPSHHGHGYPGGNLGQIRQLARSQVADHIYSRRGGRFKPTNWDEQGNPTHYDELNHADKVINTYTADEIAGRLAANRVAAGFAGGGLMGGIRAVPVVGQTALAVGAVYEGTKFISDQRAANAQYQSVLGGSNAAGLGQRFLNQGYKLSQIFSGGLNGSQADQAFKGVTALGYQGGARQNRLDFVSSNFRSMGMDPSESLKLIAVASQTTTTSLTDLEKQLKAVSQMAKETGQNASALRAAFTSNFQTLAQAGAGGGAGLIAQAQVGVTSGMGRQYANVDLSGLSSTSSMMFQANQLGMSIGQYMAKNQQTGGMTFAKGQQAQLNWAVSSAGGGSNAQAQIKAAIDQAGGPEKVAGDPNLQERIALDLMSRNVLDPLSVGNILSSMSVDVSKIAGGLKGQAAYLVGLIAKGSQSLTNQVSAGQGNNARRAMTAAELLGDQYQKEAAAGGIEGTSPQSVVDKYESANRVMDPALQKVYRSIGEKGKITVGDKTMSLKDALKDSNAVTAIDSGTAVLASGSDRGKSVGQLGWNSIGSQVGQASGSSGSGSPSGEVTVGVKMTPEAKSLLAKLGISITADNIVETGARGNSPVKPGG